MGRAYEVRKASIQKTGAAKAKLYSMYAKEIYAAAKKNSDIESNVELKRLIDKAKKDQVPSDIIKRAIDKVNSGVLESYQSARYELFGPGASTVIVDTLTDNTNRTISDIRTALNKTHSKLGSINSVAYNYDNLAIIGFKGMDIETTMDLILNSEIDIDDIEENNDMIVVYINPKDSAKVIDLIKSSLPDVEFDIDEVAMIPKETISLNEEDIEVFKKLLDMLDEIDDVNHVYHNVEL